jgi:hypothetical protein
MVAQRPMPRLDAIKLRENALTSIRLGVEDFERSRQPEGDPARALSAVRNLFAGVLLLFKYKIAICVEDPFDAAALVFNPPEILPHSDGNGGIRWEPVGKFKSTTIDVGTIQKRFKTLGIDVDWDVIEKLQECRNHLEHLHPAHTLGEVADFVAELFPVLRDFIEVELKESPVAILRDVWPLMLLHHNFFLDNTTRCGDAWAEAGVPEGMTQWLEECKCPKCSSTLLAPMQQNLDSGDTVTDNDDLFHATCMACGSTFLIAPLMIDALEYANSYDPRDGDEPTIEECYQCGRGTFVICEQSCLWCGSELEYSSCDFCEERLNQDDQDNGGMCSYHAHVYNKIMDDD